MARTDTRQRETRQRTEKKLAGFLLPEGLYTTGYLASCGLGEESLRQGRQSGKLKPIYKGHLAYYRGADLIGWILATGKDARPRQLVDGALREAVET